MSERAKHDALFNEIRLEAMNAPAQLAKHLRDIADTYHMFGADVMAVKDAAEMLENISEGYDG